MRSISLLCHVLLFFVSQILVTLLYYIYYERFINVIREDVG